MVALLLRLTFLAPDNHPRYPGGPPTRRLHRTEARQPLRPAARLARATPGAQLRLIADKNDTAPLARGAASVLVLHHINRQERQWAGFADHSRPKAVSPDGVPDRHHRKPPQMAGDFESRASKPKLMENQLLRWRRGWDLNPRYGFSRITV
jgi:hypothetical protein